jgi:hypothetical protein
VEGFVLLWQQTLTNSLPLGAVRSVISSGLSHGISDFALASALWGAPQDRALPQEIFERMPQLQYNIETNCEKYP